MALSYSVPTPLEYFASLIQVPQGGAIALLESAACIAQEEYPRLDVQQFLDEMDRLQARLQRRIAQDAEPLLRLNLLNQFFFGELGFAGNLNDYYAPQLKHDRLASAVALILERHLAASFESIHVTREKAVGRHHAVVFGVRIFPGRTFR